MTVSIEINASREENLEFLQDYNINTKKEKEILMSLEYTDFCYAVKNKTNNPKYANEILYVFNKNYKLSNESPILLKAFHCNPMYQFIYFVRSILIDGVSPSPQHYLYCILLSVVPFILGFWFFKKNEDKFIFNL